jgi:hypothetical protein
MRAFVAIAVVLISALLLMGALVEIDIPCQEAVIGGVVQFGGCQ